MLVFFCTFTLPTLGVIDMVTGNENDAVFDGVEVLSREKARAESRVKLARSLSADGDLAKTDFRKIQVQYDETRADVNAGLDRLLVELETTGSLESVESYTRLAERVAQRVETFLKSSDSLLFGDDRSGAVGAGLGLVGIVTKALVDMWKTLRSDHTDRHTLLIKRIDSLKWQQFDDI